MFPFDEDTVTVCTLCRFLFYTLRDDDGDGDVEDPFNDPHPECQVWLPCHHTFGHRCLGNYMSQHHEPPKAGVPGRPSPPDLQCPVTGCIRLRHACGHLVHPLVKEPIDPPADHLAAMCETCTTDDMKMAYGWFADAHANAVKYEQLQKVAGRVFGAGFKVPKNYWVFRRQEIKRKIDWVNARVRKGELKRLNKLALDLLNKWTRLEDFDGRWAIWMAMQSPR